MFHVNLAGEETRPRRESMQIRDLRSGEMIDVDAPSLFEIQAILLDSAYYSFAGNEYRFRISEARKCGLKVEL